MLEWLDVILGSCVYYCYYYYYVTSQIITSIKNLQVSMQVLLSGLKLYTASTLEQTHLRRAAVGERRHMCEHPPL